MAAFDDRVTWLGSESTPFIAADEAGIARGTAFLKEVEARGGTEFVPALTGAFGAIAKLGDRGRLPVVVLVTEYRPSPADARSPEAVTVGSGEALVLTRGVVVRGRWERATEADGFTLTDGDGDEIPLTVGRTWIELAPAGTARISS